MSEGFNSCSFIGNLGADSELRSTGSGTPVLNFRIAVNESFPDKEGGRREHVEWVSCVLWGKLAEVLAPMMLKGTSVFVEGQMRTTSYEPRGGGEKKWKTEINARTVRLLGGRPGNDDQRGDAHEGPPADRGGGRSRNGYAR